MVVVSMIRMMKMYSAVMTTSEFRYHTQQELLNHFNSIISDETRFGNSDD